MYSCTIENCSNPGILQCGHCKTKYCSEVCQRKDWSTHKLSCRTEWTCSDHLALDRISERGCTTSIPEEKSKFITLLTSKYMNMIHSLSVYADSMVDSTMDLMLDKLRQKGYDKTITPVITLSDQREILYLFFTLVLSDENGSDEISTLVAMALCFHLLAEHQNEYPSVLLSFPIRTGLKYECAQDAYKLRDLWLNDQLRSKKRNLAYLVIMNPKDQNISLYHGMIIRIVNNQAFIIQSHINQYTVSEWLNGSGINSKYRKTLDMRGLNELISDIDSMTLPNPKPSKYSDICGFKVDMIPEFRNTISRYCF